MPTFGRKPIYTKYQTVDESNLMEVLSAAMNDFSIMREQILHLYAVYRGNQAILQREKNVRPEINNKCVRNHANEIVSFKVSYLLSEPIMYVKRGTRDVAREINQLNEYMHLESKSAKDKEIADDFNICGHAFRMVLPAATPEDEDRAPFRIYTLDPSGAFVIRHSGLGHEVVCGVYLISNVDPLNVVHETACVYTKDRYFEVEFSSAGYASGSIRKREPHSLGCVPIFEYINNESQLGSFEIVETLLDAINTLESNRLDGTEQTVQSLMVFKNCEADADEVAAISQLGAVNIKASNGVDAGIELLSPDLNQQDQQVLMDSLYKTVLTITGMPAQSSENKSDSSNNGAVFMRAGWYSADARAKDSELLWKQSETEFLRLALKICRDYGKLELRVSDVDMKFTRRNYEDILSKSQSLTNMLTAGIHPLYAIAQCGLFSDPSEVFSESTPYLKKWVYEEDGEEEEDAPKKEDEQDSA